MTTLSKQDATKRLEELKIDYDLHDFIEQMMSDVEVLNLIIDAEFYDFGKLIRYAEGLAYLGDVMVIDKIFTTEYIVPSVSERYRKYIKDNATPKPLHHRVKYIYKAIDFALDIQE